MADMQKHVADVQEHAERWSQTEQENHLLWQTLRKALTKLNMDDEVDCAIASHKALGDCAVDPLSSTLSQLLLMRINEMVETPDDA